MKRRFPSSIPDLSELPSPRKRVLSEEERALWDSVARQTKPLRKKRLAKAGHSKAGHSKAAHAKDQHAKDQHSKDPPSKAPAPSTSVRPPNPPARPMPSAALPKPSTSAVPPLVSLGRRGRARLSRGKDEIEARLDLHGMTQVRAHHALFGFLQRAHRDGMTFVLVITGKGKVGSAEQERGVLRRQVPHWLGLPEFRALVVGFEEAHAGHGGEGALYVRVRRPRG
jgi:DNA-nicking Smr family endonuclease